MPSKNQSLAALFFCGEDRFAGSCDQLFKMTVKVLPLARKHFRVFGRIGPVPDLDLLSVGDKEPNGLQHLSIAASLI